MVERYAYLASVEQGQSRHRLEASLLRRQKRLLSAIPYAAVGETLVTLRKLVGCRTCFQNDQSRDQSDRPKVHHCRELQNVAYSQRI